MKKFLKSLPRRKYIHIVASLEQVLDLNLTIFEDIVGRLKAYEERIREDDEEQEEDKSKLLYSNTESQQDQYGGRGRGRGQWRGRGRGRYDNFQQQREAYRQGVQRDTSHITCFKCDIHYPCDCPYKLLKLQETAEKKDEDTQDADDLIMHEVVYLNEQKVDPINFESDQDSQNLWYLDNGASNHMSGNRAFFYQLDEGITGKVQFGDNSCIDIKGKGSIRFTFAGGSKKILKDVYYIPALRSNIVSLGQATKAGCEVRMKENTLMLYDRQGRVMIETVRSKNRLYKVTLHADEIHCLQLDATTQSSMWHARLGHANTEAMKLMINKELAIGLPKITVDKETCESCLRGK